MGRLKKILDAQTFSRAQNALYHKLISEFGRQTGLSRRNSGIFPNNANKAFDVVNPFDPTYFGPVNFIHQFPGAFSPGVTTAELNDIAVAALHLLFTLVTGGLWQLVFCFLYNRQYMTRMLTDGWVLADNPERNALAAAKLGIA